MVIALASPLYMYFCQRSEPTNRREIRRQMHNGQNLINSYATFITCIYVNSLLWLTCWSSDQLLPFDITNITVLNIIRTYVRNVLPHEWHWEQWIIDPYSKLGLCSSKPFQLNLWDEVVLSVPLTANRRVHACEKVRKGEETAELRVNTFYVTVNLHKCFKHRRVCEIWSFCMYSNKKKPVKH